jgi:hypothetical protein
MDKGFSYIHVKIRCYSSSQALILIRCINFNKCDWYIALTQNDTSGALYVEYKR